MQSVVDTLPGDWADSSLVAEGDEVVDDEDVVLVLLRADVILESNLMSVIGFTLADLSGIYTGRLNCRSALWQQQWLQLSS